MNQSSFLNLPTIPSLPREKDNQGQRAVKSGRVAESTIHHILSERGYKVERQFPIGPGIFGGELRVDFHVTRIPQFPSGLIIESKWQQTAGTVDEKFPYLVLNIKQRYPCPAIVVCAGGGARPLAVSWLRKQADGDKLFAVFSFEEFLTWTNRNL